jgi:hypothetical protein
VIGRRVIAGYALLAAIGAASVSAAVAEIKAGALHRRAAPRMATRRTPADDFASTLEGTANAAAAENGGPTISNVSCLPGNPGNYFCAYLRSDTHRCSAASVTLRPTGEIVVHKAGRVAVAAGDCTALKAIRSLS